MSKTFRRLIEKSNWGYLEYYWKNNGKEELASFDPMKTGKATIKWPTGREEKISFYPETIYDRICDMGHDTDVTTHRPMVDYNIFGLSVQIPLTNFLVKDIKQE
mgnify:CR=1 FL=1